MFIQDELGNRIYSTNDGVFLKIKKEPASQKLLDFVDGELVKTFTKKELPNKTTLVNFNYSLLNYIIDSNLVKDNSIKVVIKDVVSLAGNYINGEYTVDIRDILEVKRFLNPDKKGFELQCLYPISYLKTYERETMLEAKPKDVIKPKFQLIPENENIDSPKIGEKISYGGESGTIDGISNNEKNVYVRFHGGNIKIVKIEDIEKDIEKSCWVEKY